MLSGCQIRSQSFRLSYKWGGVKSLTKSSIFVAFLLSFLCTDKRTFWGLVFPSSLFAAFYAPFGYTYGTPDYQALSSLLATDTNEASEFLSLIPAGRYLRGLCVPMFVLIAYEIARRQRLRPWRNKTFLTVNAIVLVLLWRPTSFFQDLWAGYQAYEKDQAELKKFVSASDWGTSHLADSSPRNYILIIGESVRRDYMHVYGYPVANTPYLDKAAATIVTGLHAGGTYTIGSLRNMLTLPDKERWEPNYALNLVDLAKSASIRTIWISNQGFIGKFDTPISSIGNRADKTVFSKTKEYDSINVSDYWLLDKFAAVLSHPADRPQLIVLHTIGSHPDACKRIEDFEEKFSVTKSELSYVACYVASIAKADLLIKKIHNLTQSSYQKTGVPYSIIYFADHGLIHVKKDSKIVINNNKASKLHYNIPLIRIDADQSERRLLKSEKSGLSFTEGLATWMGIENSRLSRYDLFDGISDPDDHGLQKKIDAINEPPDPAVDITDALEKKK